MQRLFLASLACLTSILSAQGTLDQSSVLNAQRTAMLGDFNKAQVQLRQAKAESERQAAYDVIADVAARAGALRTQIVKANEDVIQALNFRRAGKQDRSATIKAVTEKLTAGNRALLALPLPSGPQFTAAEVNQVQRVLDVSKTTLDSHRHACQNLPR